MFGNRSVSPMQARREALACDILQIYSDFFMAVHGHRKTHARLIAQGWDSGEVGRDQVMRNKNQAISLVLYTEERIRYVGFGMALNRDFT